MKKIFSYMILAVSLVWGCTEDHMQPSAGEGRILIEATAGCDTKVVLTDGDSRMDMRWKAEGEKITVVSGQSVLVDHYAQVSVSADGRTAIFEGAEPADNAQLSLMYPAVKAATALGGSLPSGSNANVWTLDMTGQSGRLDESKIYMYASHTYSKGEPVSATLRHITSLIRAELTFPVSGTVKNVTFSAPELVRTINFSPYNKRHNQGNPTCGELALSGEFTTDGSGKITVWLHILPEKYLNDASAGYKQGISFPGGLQIKADVGGKPYVANIVRTKAMTSGVVYNLKAQMEDDPEVSLAAPVEIKNKKLYVNGEEFFIKGACINGGNSVNGHFYYDWAAKSGVNVLRSYSINDFSTNNSTQDNLAHIEAIGKLGMYIDFGISVNNYYKSEWDPEVVKPELTYIRPYLSNPYILMWNIGNEMENGAVVGSADQTKLDGMWAFIDGMAKLIKANDPYKRPITTTLAGYNQAMFNDCLAKCPNLDFISINSYHPHIGNIHSMLNANYNYVRSGKPYSITEYGPVGTWEGTCPKTRWGAVIEGSANEKSKDFYDIHENYIEAHKDEGCIGGFTFLWGYQTHGAVGTYYAMFDEFEHYALPQVDGMARAFGVTPEVDAPVIESRYDLTIDGNLVDSSDTLYVGDTFKAEVLATSPSGVPLTYDWYIVKDAYLSGTMQEAGFVLEQYNDQPASITIPVLRTEGKYRLIVYARDDVNRKASMASFPFFVSAAKPLPKPDPGSTIPDINIEDF